MHLPPCQAPQGTASALEKIWAFSFPPPPPPLYFGRGGGCVFGFGGGLFVFLLSFMGFGFCCFVFFGGFFNFWVSGLGFGWVFFFIFRWFLVCGACYLCLFHGVWRCEELPLTTLLVLERRKPYFYIVSPLSLEVKHWSAARARGKVGVVLTTQVY